MKFLFENTSENFLNDIKWFLVARGKQIIILYFFNNKELRPTILLASINSNQQKLNILFLTNLRESFRKYLWELFKQYLIKMGVINSQ